MASPDNQSIMSKKIKTNWLILLLVLILAQFCLGESRFTIEEYLQLPDPVQLQTPFHMKLREDVLKLEVDEYTHSVDIMALIWLQNKIKANFYYKTLEELSSIFSECSKELISIVKSLLAQMRVNPDDKLNHRAYVKFLSDYGQRKFDSCAMSVYRRHMMMKAKFSTKSLDKFFAAALNVSQTKASSKEFERQLINKLQGLDLTRAELNVPAMQKVAYNCITGGDSFGSFMNRECRNLLASHRYELDVLNLDKFFNGHEIQIEKLAKLNEYYRLCLAWQNYNKRNLILGNISKHQKFSVKTFSRAW